MKKSIIPIDQFCDQYEITKGSVWAKACIYRESNGVNPKWYIKPENSGCVLIDEYEFFKFSQIESEAWNYNTDPDGVYFTLSDRYKISDNRIAAYLTNSSSIYTNQMSWCVFMSKSMFATPMIKTTERITMQIEFLRIASRLLYNCIKHEKEYGYEATILKLKG